MIISLQGKRALVGGSTQGLGKAVAMQLALSGATVTLMARDEENMKKVVSELSTECGQKHQYIKVDFLNIQSFKQKMEDYFIHNKVDILVNNTNGPSAGSVFEKNLEDYEGAFNLLFQTVCCTSLLAIPYMQKQKFGRIINMSSVTVQEPLSHLVLSNSIRSAVASWSKTLASELAPHGITVNNILTGYFETERLKEIMTQQARIRGIEIEEVKNSIQNGIAAKRLGNPVEYGYLVSFLASEMAAYITGTSIPIDGGFLKSL